MEQKEKTKKKGWGNCKRKKIMVKEKKMKRKKKLNEKKEKF